MYRKLTKTTGHLILKCQKNLTKINMYNRVHISSDEVSSKILKKPSIVQKKMIPHMKAKLIFIGKTQQIYLFKKKNNQKPKKCHFPAPPPILNIFSQKFQALVLG